MTMKVARKAKAWSVANKLTALSIGLTAFCSLASLVVSTFASKSSSKAQDVVAATRVETDSSNSNSNEPDYDRRWQPWEFPISTRTLYVGVQRKVLFKQPFKVVPHVSTAISSFDTGSLDSKLEELGYRPDAAVGIRLRDTHILSSVDDVTKTGFTLEIGVGLPSDAENFVKGILSEHILDDQFVDDLKKYRQVSPRADRTLNADEAWMANFYRHIGSIQVSWIAQAPGD